LSKIGVVIPWREEESRLKPLQYVLDWYAINLPHAEIFFADKPGEWQHSGTRNLGVKKAQEALCDIIICNDADTTPEIASLNTAIESAKSDLFIHNPYTMCHYLDKDSTQAVLDGGPLGQSMVGVTMLSWVCGGVFVFQPEAWWRLGGMDEKITTGPEDLALQRAHEVINGTKIVKHAGNIYCFWHERIEKETKQDWEREAYNQSLYSEYLKTYNPTLMIELVHSAKRS
jgi:hypothetical protein